MKSMKPKDIKSVVTPNKEDLNEQVQPLSKEIDMSEKVNSSIDQSMPRKIKIALCVPLYGFATSNWIIHFYRLLMESTKLFEINLHMEDMQPVDRARNELMKAALSSPFDYLLFLDADNMLPPKAIPRMIQTMIQNKASLVTALYFGKTPPYYSVMREYRSNGFWRLDNMPLGQHIEIAGFGMGCALIKRDVFDQIEKPYFMFSNEKWARKDIQLSEDLYFCRKLMKKGMKIICDTSIVCGHMGGVVEAMEYESYRNIRETTKLERIELENDMMSYLKLSRFKYDTEILSSGQDFEETWNNDPPKNYEDRKKFWRESERYLYLANAVHFSDRRKFDIELATSLQSYASRTKEVLDRKVRVLDFGGGIGQNSIMLSRMGFDVTYADIEGLIFNFVEHRVFRNNLDLRFWHLDIEDGPHYQKYDIILCLDVLEHLSREDFRKYIPLLMKLKEPHTKVIVTHNRKLVPSTLKYDRETECSLHNLLNAQWTDEDINTPDYWDTKWDAPVADGAWDYKEKFSEIVKHIKETKGDRTNIKVVDLGSGTGILLDRILKNIEGVEGHAIDYSQSAINRATIRNPLIVGHCQDITKPLAINKTMDYVIGTELLEHLNDKDIETLLSNVKVMMDKDSTFICSTPNNMMARHVCAEHLQDFDEDSFRAVLSKRFSKVVIRTIDCIGWNFLLAFCKI